MSEREKRALGRPFRSGKLNYHDSSLFDSRAKKRYERAKSARENSVRERERERERERGEEEKEREREEEKEREERKRDCVKSGVTMLDFFLSLNPL